MRRLPLALALAAFAAACTDFTADLDEPVEPLGDFRMGFVEVVAPNLTALALTQEASAEEWTTAVDSAVERRLGRFDGARFYHLGISVEEYAISVRVPGVPSRSAVAVRVTVWEDATQSKLNPETEVISVIKLFEAKLALSREEKIEMLAEELAFKIEQWMRSRNEEAGWFGGPAAAEDVEGTEAAGAEPAEAAGPGAAPPAES